LCVLGEFAKLREATGNFVVSVSVHPSVRPPACLSAYRKSTPTGRIFMKIHIEDFSKTCRENSSFRKMTTIMGVLHINLCIFMVSLIRMRNVADKSRRENQNTRFVFSNVVLNIGPVVR
jgi:hypothetical protein